MLKVKLTSQFKRDYKNLKKTNADISKLREVVDLLVDDKSLPEKYKNHKLLGVLKGCEECHIEPDWLLIYRKEKQTLTLVLMRTGSHAKLFNR